MNKPIGILGGTFDPIHQGHLEIAQTILKTCDLDHIEFIPCGIPPHREAPIANAQERLTMVKLATQNNPLFVANDIEIKRDGISYMADTLETLQKQYPNTPLCLLIGFDAFKQFNTWRYHEKILTLAHLIVIHRPNVSLDSEAWIQSFLQAHQTKNIQDLHQKAWGKVYLELNPSNDLSSSDVRANKMLEDLPPLVADYISTHGLYQ